MRYSSEEPERDYIRITVTVGAAALSGGIRLPFEHLGWGNHLPIVAGVLS
jgi:hypothetical protein